MTKEETEEEEDKDKKDEGETSYVVPLVLGGIGAAGLALGATVLSPMASRGVAAFNKMVNSVQDVGVVDPARDLDSYIQGGSEAAGGNIFGVGVVPFMSKLRVSPLTPKDWRYWDSETEAHYKDFSAGPMSAYFRYLDEHLESEKHNNVTNSVLDSRPSIFTSPIQFIKSIGNKEEEWTKRINALTGDPDTVVSEKGIEEMKELANNIDKKNYVLPTIVSSIKSRARELGSLFGYGNSDFSEIPRGTQEAMYSKLNEYIKNTDPELHKNKVFTDMVQGAYRVPFSSYSYGPLTRAMQTTKDVLLYGGGTLLAAGGGIALYKHLKAKEEKQKKEKKRK